MSAVVIGVFQDTENAQEAISDLEAKGYNPKDMSILMKDQSDSRRISQDTGVNKVAGGAMEGAGTGAVLGGIAGFLAGTVLPGLGGFLIGGPIGAALGLTGAAATTVSGAATGAVAGGLIGALTNTFGLTENEAKVYEARINEGGILVAVPAHSGDEGEVKEILVEFGADSVRIVRSDSTREKTSFGKSSRDEGEESYIRS